MMERRVVRNDDIAWRRIEDEIVVIANDGKTVHILNKTTAYIWELCDGTRNLDEIAACLFERFDVPLEEVSADIQNVTAELQELRLLDKTNEVNANER